MSTATQTPLEEAAERIAEGLPASKLAGLLVGLEDYRERAAMHRNQVKRDYAQQNALLESLIAHEGGPQVPSGEGEEGESLGDIILTGDITVTNQDQLKQAIELLKGKALNQTTEQQKPAEPVAQPQAASDGLTSKLGTAAIIGASVLGGSGVTALALNYLNQPDPPAVTEIIDGREYGIKGYVDTIK